MTKLSMECIATIYPCLYDSLYLSRPSEHGFSLFTWTQYIEFNLLHLIVTGTRNLQVLAWGLLGLGYGLGILNPIETHTPATGSTGLIWILTPLERHDASSTVTSHILQHSK